MRMLSVLAVCLALPAAAQEDNLEWVSYAFDPFEPSDTGLRLFYGLDQTDFVVVSASCGLGDDGPVITAGFSAELAPGTVDGQPVFLEFPGLAGALPLVNGNAVGVGAEIGISGVSVTLPADDRLWAHMIMVPRFSFGMRGTDAMVEIPGDQGGVISGFVSACQAAGAAGAPAAATPPAQTVILEPAAPTPPPALPTFSIGDTAAEPACGDLSSLASEETGQARSVQVVNDSGGTRGITFIGTDGTLSDLGQLQPGQSGTLDTDAGHLWMITDGPGNCLELFETGDATEFRLTDAQGNQPTSPATEAPAQDTPPRVDTK